MTRLGWIALGIVLTGTPGIAQDIRARPTVVPYRLDGKTIAFLVTATNATGADLLVVSYASRCKARIDGATVLPVYRGGSGGGRTVPSGEKWQELHRLVTAPEAPGPVLNPDPKTIAVMARELVTLTSGRHMIAFSCGGEWSADVPFDWNSKQ